MRTNIVTAELQSTDFIDRPEHAMDAPAIIRRHAAQDAVVRQKYMNVNAII